MTDSTAAISGLAMMFVLGIRHGFDPDHIACIDGFTWRSVEQGKRFAPWVGTLFALGHGFIVTLIAVGVGALAQSVRVPDAMMAVFAWAPTLLLFVIGLLNLRGLLRANGEYRPVLWKSRLLPEPLRKHSNPFSIVLVGMLFAVVFDTATQAAMWTYAATTNGGTRAALIAGVAFTMGMMLTDTIDGRLLLRIVGRAGEDAHGGRRKRVLGWMIVVFSLGAGVYNVAKALLPMVEVDDRTYSLAGAALVLVVFTMWLRAHRQTARPAGRCQDTAGTLSKLGPRTDCE
jgi:high-affinity nickel-transport protein